VKQEIKNTSSAGKSQGKKGKLEGVDGRIVLKYN
jgi:hypothetical protein